MTSRLRRSLSQQATAANEAKVAPVLAQYLLGRQMPQKALPRSQKAPVMQKLLNDYLVMKAGGVGAETMSR